MHPLLNPAPFIPRARPRRIDLIGPRGHHARRRVLPALTAFAGAFERALQFIEQAQAQARPLPVYADAARPEEAFVCDWS